MIFSCLPWDAVSYGLIDAIIDHPTNVAVSASGIQMYTSDN